jgi:hypothetical protein
VALVITSQQVASAAEVPQVPDPIGPVAIVNESSETLPSSFTATTAPFAFASAEDWHSAGPVAPTRHSTTPTFTSAELKPEPLTVITCPFVSPVVAEATTVGPSAAPEAVIEPNVSALVHIIVTAIDEMNFFIFPSFSVTI